MNLDPNIVKALPLVSKYEERGDYPYFWTILVWLDREWKQSGLGNWTRTPEDAREEIKITMSQYNMREVFVRGENYV